MNEQREQLRLLERVLDTLREDQRAVLVMVDIEQFTVPEAAEALGVNVNTAYWRLRKARQQFEYHALGHEDFPIEFGIEHRDFWLSRNECDAASAFPFTIAGMSGDDACEDYSCGGLPTRFCSYTASAGYRSPTAYYASATFEFLATLR